MRFELGTALGTPRTNHRPVVVLRSDSWDDFGLKTLFTAKLYSRTGETIELGDVKIMQRGRARGATALPGGSFLKLSSDFCSLGQSAEYYEKLSSLSAKDRSELLRGLRDAATSDEIRRDFVGTDGWRESLTRFGTAAHALEVGKELAIGKRKRTPGVASFQYVRGGESPLTVQFSFDDQKDLPGRTNVVIGYNGVGKTHLLADLARAASTGGASGGALGTLGGEDSTFGSVIAVSYSAFDDFELPQDLTRDQSVDYFENEPGRTELFGYVYCGLRRIDDRSTGSATLERHELKSVVEIDQEMLKAMSRARHHRLDGQPLLARCFELLEREPSFGRIGVHPTSWLEITGNAKDDIKSLSTGHKIVLNIITQLAAHLKPRSIVLLDEPETHLHPPLLAAMLRVLQLLLDAHDSFMIVATHSPVVLQEVPASSVRVLSRFGSYAEVASPEIETFGANVGAITRHVFSLDSSATDYQGVLAHLAEKMPLDEIEALFAEGMSDQARALVLRAQRTRS